jgi:hypothetical protein
MVTKPSQTEAAGALAAFSVVSERYGDLAATQRYLVHTMVAQLRAEGFTWRDIGKAAGMSHVAAMKRWKADPVKPERVVEYFGDPEDL